MAEITLEGATTDDVQPSEVDDVVIEVEVDSDDEPDDDAADTPRLPTDDEVGADLQQLQQDGLLVGSDVGASPWVSGGGDGVVRPNPDSQASWAGVRSWLGSPPCRASHGAERVLDVSRIPTFGCDLVVVREGAPPHPARGASGADLDEWIVSNVDLMVEVKASKGATPSALRFPLRENAQGAVGAEGRCRLRSPRVGDAPGWG